MKKAAAYILTFLVLSFLCAPRVSAQSNDRTDIELETYASLCDSCLMLKKSLSEGTTISSKSARQVIGRFVETGKRLKSDYSSMTPWQKDIYRIITERFSSSSYNDPFIAQIPGLPALDSGIIEDNGKPETIRNGKNEIGNDIKMHCSKNNYLKFNLLISASFPHFCGGLMFGIQYRGWGGYVKGASNFTKAENSYICLSNGTLADGSEFWGGGQDQLEIKSLTAGAMFPIIKFISIYAGAGTGKWKLAWMDMDSNWAKVSDLSHSGISAEAGIVTNWKFIAVSAGITTIRFNTFQANVGVGVRF